MPDGDNMAPHYFTTYMDKNLLATFGCSASKDATLERFIKTLERQLY